MSSPLSLRFLGQSILPSSPLVLCKEFKISVPLLHSSVARAGSNEKHIDIFFRVLYDKKSFDSNTEREYLLFLQGGL